MKSSLSVCIISKDEEKNIEKCIKSVKKLADEVIVVDTGSTDNTVKIAKRLGAKVIIATWENDFSKARNISLDNATKEWILVLDCDEIIAKSDFPKIRSLMNLKDYEAFNLKIMNFENGRGVFEAVVLRLFRNRDEFRFQGKIHEQIASSIVKFKDEKSIGNSDAIIKHYGYDKELVDIEAKKERNLNLLLSYSEADKNAYYYYALANEYYRMQNLDKAIEIYKISINKLDISNGIPIYYPYLANNLVSIYYNQKNFKSCIDIIQKFKAEIVDFKYLYLMEAICYFDIGKVSKASECLDNYFEITDNIYQYPVFEVMSDLEVRRLKKHLDNQVIECDEELVTIWINMNRWDDKVLNCIKSFNDIAGQIIVITCENKNMDILKNYGVEVILTNPMHFFEMFSNPKKITKNKNILILFPFETCTRESSIQLVNYLSDDEYVSDMSYIRTLNKTKERYKEEVRLIKNDSSLLNRKVYDEYSKNNKSEIFDTEIYINSDFID